MSRPALTQRQDEVLRFVCRLAIPPTRADIAVEFGFRSANAAEDHLRALERKGYIRLERGMARGIYVLPDYEAVANAIAGRSA